MAETIDKENIEKQIKIWQDFVNKQENDKFILNPDKEAVERLAKGVLINEKNNFHSLIELRYCLIEITLKFIFLAIPVGVSKYFFGVNVFGNNESAGVNFPLYNLGTGIIF